MAAVRRAEARRPEVLPIATRPAYRTEERYIVDAIHFGILSPTEIRKIAKVTLVTYTLYDADGSPVPGGPRDPHFGALEPGEICPVCGNTRNDCPGHFGKIDLARPVIHPHYSEFIRDVLQTTCRACGRLRIPPERLRYLRSVHERLKTRWPKLARALEAQVKEEASKRMECPHCGARQFKIKFVKPLHFYEDRPEGEILLTPTEIRGRLENTMDEDLELLGLDPKRARPEWMVLTVLPVPPLSVRPSITLETAMRSEDDLTHALIDIVKRNEKLKREIQSNSPESVIESYWFLLQYSIAAYIDNELNIPFVLTQRRKRPLKTLAMRLRGKEGRFRGNLSGKRVNFSARTVISPDPLIGINEVGVPIEIAKILTVPVVVTPYNIDELRRYVMNGPDKWPGATHVYKKRQNVKIDLKYQRDLKSVAESLEPGDVVERHLINGDIVLFNRQPSLHRMSIMGHIVRVMPGKTFRLNLLVCPPYNADFDGDEMNLHVPRLEEARAEARELLLVEKHILTPRYGGPIIGGRQDYISGAYLLTVKTAYFTKEEVQRLLAIAGYEGDFPEPAILKPKPLWTGKQLVSLFLPKDMVYKGKAKINAGALACDGPECFNDSYIVIREGRLLEGVFDKNAIGAEQPMNVIHYIARVYGHSKAREILDTMYKMFIRMLEMRGLTMAYSDIEVSDEAKKQISELVERYRKEVERLIQDYKEGRLEPMPGRTVEETLEMRIIEVLNKLRDEAGKVAVSDLDPFNDVFIMARTGARGSDLNIAQMAAMLGQQTVRGKRIHRGLRNRPLPHFKPGDLGPEARGFIKGNFRDGLDPTEVFMHAVAGREGLIDTAVKTSQSGYMQRRLINALVDLYVDYDGTVKDASGNIIQFKYGEDGIDPMLSYHGKAVDVDLLIERAKVLFREESK